MNCPNCNYTMPDGNYVCPVCGCQIDPYAQQARAEDDKLSKKTVWTLVGGIAGGVFLLIILPLIMMSGSGGGGGGIGRLPSFLTTSEEPVISASLPDFDSDEHFFYCGTPHEVLFTVTAGAVDADISVFSGKANAVNTMIGAMHDDGLAGDITAGDGIFSLLYSFTVPESEAGEHEYFARSGSNLSAAVTLHDVTDSQIDQAQASFEDMDADIAAIEAQFDPGEDPDAALASAQQTYTHIKEYFEQKKNEGVIDDYTVDGTTFTASVPGGTYVYEYDPSHLFEGMGLFFQTIVMTGDDILTAPAAGQPNLIITCQPFADSLVTTAFDDGASRAAEREDYDFTANMDNGQVSLDLLTDLTAYKLVIWNGHGGYDSTYHSYLVTGTMSASMPDRFRADLVGDHPAVITAGSGRCCVTSRFFDKYYRTNKMDDAMIFLGCCEGGHDSVLADSLIGAGFSTVFGFDQSVAAGYDRAMFTSLINAMLTDAEDGRGGTTAVDALSAANEANGGSDPYNAVDGWWDRFMIWIGWDHLPATLRLFGDQNYRLYTNEGVLSGKVCRAQDRATPIEGASVEVVVDGRPVVAYTDAQGNYEMTLPAGTNTALISAEGYLSFRASALIETDQITYMETFLMVEGQEGDTGTASGTVYNSLTGEGEGGVTLSFVKDWNSFSGEEPTGDVIRTAATDSSGAYTVELPIGNYTAVVEKEGFLTGSFNIVVQNGETSNQDGTITPEVAGTSFLITLTWGADPRDMDSHMVGVKPNGYSFHVFYADMYASYNGERICTLDYDDTQSYGPEHITVEATGDSPYYYYVYKYAGSGTTGSSGATVTVHQGNVLIATFHVPTNLGDGDYWNVFAIVNGRLVVRNTITDSAELGYAR